MYSRFVACNSAFSLHIVCFRKFVWTCENTSTSCLTRCLCRKSVRWVCWLRETVVCAQSSQSLGSLVTVSLCLCLVLNNKVLFSIAISNFYGLIGFLLFHFVKSVYNRNLTVWVVAFWKVNATLSQYCYDLVFPDSRTFWKSIKKPLDLDTGFLKDLRNTHRVTVPPWNNISWSKGALEIYWALI